jgi:hypothetical protein
MKITIITWISILAALPVQSQDIDSLSEIRLVEGEILFHGFTPEGDTLISCASCHFIAAPDTFNWMPSAREVASSTKTLDLEEFKEVLWFSLSDASMDSHIDIEMEDEQLIQIRAYLHHLLTQDPPIVKPDRSPTRIFAGLTILLLLILTDLWVTRWIRPRLIHGSLFSLIIVFIIVLFSGDVIALGLQQGYEPDQPIKFSHKIHAGENGTECLYCHHTAERAKHAGIPSVSLCINCHILIRESSYSGEFEIKKLIDIWEGEQNLEWIRVHQLPDHVYFNHALHYEVGQIDCTECHGAVEENHRIRQEEDLSMGWCLDCHRSRRIQFAGNKYYDQYLDLRAELETGKIDSVLVKDLGGLDCMHCHY